MKDLGLIETKEVIETYNVPVKAFNIEGIKKLEVVLNILEDLNIEVMRPFSQRQRNFDWETEDFGYSKITKEGRSIEINYSHTSKTIEVIEWKKNIAIIP